MKTKLATLLIAALLWSGAPLHLGAQLVADGGTLNLTTATNLAGNLTVGVDSALTTLNIIAPGAVTNGHGYIGFGISSDFNVVTLRNSGAIWKNNGSLWVGESGNNNQVVVSNGAALSANGDGHIGYNSSAYSNAVHLTGTGSLWTSGGEINVGYSGGNSQLVISNGATVANGNGYIGRSSFGNLAVVAGAGSLWTNRFNLNVGWDSAANRLVISDGGTVANNIGIIGAGLASVQNLVEVVGAGSLWTNNGSLSIGNSGGANRLIVSNGATVASKGGFIGAAIGYNRVMVTGTDSIWNNRDFLWVGGSSSESVQNELTITNGGTVANTAGYLGYGSGSSDNFAVVTGTGSFWTNSGALYVGFSGVRNQLVVSNGATVASADGYLCHNPSSSNNVAVVTGPGSLWTNSNSLWVGNSGSGNRLVVSNGAVVTDFSAHIGGFGSDNNVAVVTGAGSRWNTDDSLSVGLGGGSSGNQLIISNGATVASGFGSFEGHDGVAMVTDPGSLWTNSSTLYVGSSSSGNQLIVSNGATVRANNAHVGFPAGSPGYSNNVLRLANGTFIAPGGLTVNLNNTLDGSGTVNGPVTIASGGALSPGASFGRIVLNSSPVLQGNVVMEISKNGATFTNDHLQVNSALTYGGKLTVTNLGMVLTVGDSFQLFSATSYSGAFASYNLPALPVGLEWSTPQTNGLLTVRYVTQPVITSMTRFMNQLNFFLKGSPTNKYELVTATNVTVPAASWVTVWWGEFDVAGDALGFHFISVSEPQRFYRVKLP